MVSFIKMSMKSMTIMIPATIWNRMEEIEKTQGIRKEDIIMRAVVKVIEEFEKGGKE